MQVLSKPGFDENNSGKLSSYLSYEIVWPWRQFLLFFADSLLNVETKFCCYADVTSDDSGIALTFEYFSKVYHLEKTSSTALLRAPFLQEPVKPRRSSATALC